MRHFSCPFGSGLLICLWNQCLPKISFGRDTIRKNGVVVGEPNAENSKGTLMTQGLRRDSGPGNSDGSLLIRELSGRQCIWEQGPTTADVLCY